jgi:hypothetical protein
MKKALAEQRDPCLSIPHPFDQFQLVDMTLNQSIVLGEGQPCHHCGLVSLNTGSKPLQFTNLARFDLLKPGVQPFSGACPQHLGKLLNQVVGQLNLWVKVSEGDERLLFIGIQVFRPTKKKESRRL